MAAFSHNQDPSFFLDQSAFFPNPTTATAAPAAVVCFPQFHQPLNNHHAIHHHHDQTNSVSNKLHSPDSSLSMVLDEHKVESTPGNEFLPQKRKDKQVISYNAQSKDTNNNKIKKQKKTSDNQEDKRKKKANKNSCEEEEGTVGYIHVRARRGQATDSHSLAERVRREKISERMKLLQAIVPGCDKVTGKALMLDEIINYVQSLQNQVEFLSMKLASVNPMLYDFGIDMDTFMLKPDENMSSMQVLPIMPSVQVSVDGEGGSFVPTNDNYNNYLLPQLVNHGSAVTSSLLFQHSQMPNVSSQGIGQQLWDVDEQRLKLDNRFVVSDSLTSFH